MNIMTLEKHLKPKREPVETIIDNRTQKMSEKIKNILPEINIAKFAVGYFFISGFETLQNELFELDELYILMGNTSDSKTVDQIAQGYFKLQEIKKKAKINKFQSPGKRTEKLDKTISTLSETISFMDQTDQSESYIHKLVKMIEENRLFIKVYTKGTFHAKAYIFSKKNQGAIKGYSLVGSSNLSLSGIEHNTELNLFVTDPLTFNGLQNWFSEIWNEAVDFNKDLIKILKNSWALNQISPYDLYIKTLYEIVKIKTDTEEDHLLYYDKKFPELLEYQEVAFKQAIKILQNYNGVFIADVVGLGKTFIGTALLKYYQMKYHTSALIVCPPALVEMWEFFKNRYGLSVKILSNGELSQTFEQEDGTRISKYAGFETDPEFQYFDIVLIDESHNYRNSNTVRYNVLSPFTQDRKVILLTATPQNNSPWDIYNQIRLFHPNDETLIPIEGGNLKKYFNSFANVKYSDLDGEQRKERSLRLQRILRHILIRRPRSHIENYYAKEDEKGNKYLDLKKGDELIKAYFPTRILNTWSYSIDSTYNGVYDEIYNVIGHRSDDGDDEDDEECLKYAYYSIGSYLKEDAKDKLDKKGNKIYANLSTAGKNLRGLIRTLLFKRFESSVYSFTQTIKRMLHFHDLFLNGLKNQKILTGKESQKFMKNYFNEIKKEDYIRIESSSELEDNIMIYANTTFDIEDFKLDHLIQDVEEDLNKLNLIYDIIKEITPDKDDKLQELIKKLSQSEFQDPNRKILIFTQFVDTANYIDNNLSIYNDSIKYQIDSSTSDKNQIIARFAPKSNEDLYKKLKKKNGEQISEFQVLISTDVLSEGLNLQDCYTIINYDLHWNPVRLIQRIGRIDRIGTEAESIFIYNFLPERELEEKLGIREILHARIQEIQDVIGEDSKILDHTEIVNPDAIYAIYNGSEKERKDLFDSTEDDELLFGLNEAEELIRKLTRENQDYIEYIMKLPLGLRSGKINKNFPKDHYFSCFQSGPFMKFYLMDEEGNLITDDLIKCLNAIRCSKDELNVELSSNFKKFLIKTTGEFSSDVKNYREEIKNKSKIAKIQRDLSDKLISCSKNLEDEQLIKKIKSLTLMFEMPLPERIVKSLKKLNNQNLQIEELVDGLSDIYTKNRIPELQKRLPSTDDLGIPRIVTSMYLKKDEI